jgi:hypothetical protein
VIENAFKLVTLENSYGFLKKRWASFNNCIEKGVHSTYRALESSEGVAARIAVLEGGCSREIGRQILQQQGPVYARNTSPSQLIAEFREIVPELKNSTLISSAV